MASRGKIVNTVLEGIQEAQNDYFDMASAWAWEGAEYWITVYVARKLWDMEGNGRVTVEGNSNEALKKAGRYRGRPRRVINNKRFDIVLWKANGGAKAPIEIKNQRDSSSILNDMERISAAIKQSNIKFGIVGYFYSRTRGKRNTAIELVKSYMKTICEKSKDQVEEGVEVRHRSGKICGDENDAWCCGVLTDREEGHKEMLTFSCHPFRA